MGAIGFGTFVAGIYVCVAAGNFSWYNGAFVLLGALEMSFGLLAWKMRRSPGGLLFYLLIVLTVLVLQLGFTIGMISDQSAWAGSVGESNANAIQYVMLVFCMIIAVCWVFAWCYRRNLHESQYSAGAKD
jgi:hypothetical protein